MKKYDEVMQELIKVSDRLDHTEMSSEELEEVVQANLENKKEAFKRCVIVYLDGWDPVKSDSTDYYFDLLYRDFLYTYAMFQKKYKYSKTV